ncbi:heme exporter protein D [Arthrobacter pigmenti]|uniref:Heme exporter protein D n=1 Tax=Arthrobacter pigmenti TaxID=271432 RepID=A0A846RXY9_9MICC|nr:hypothetical protein [Arthrobacter pigmenti]NJC23071.1 heme exporter protein D [Arthrobacter pigmenti]
MDFSLNSSVVLAAIVGLWLIWVAPYLLRRRVSQPAVGSITSALSSTAAGDAGFQRSVMNMSSTEEPASASRRAGNVASGASQRTHPAPPEFRVRWGRLGIALAGSVSVVTALVTSVLAVMAVIPSVVPVLALLVAIVSVVALRTLALRDRRRRRAGAARPAAEQSAAPAEHEDPAVQRPTKLFDGESAPAGTTTADDDDASEPVANPFTAAELRAAALAVAAEAGDPAIGQGAPWQPVEVPKPTYVEAPKAERGDPAPLDLPDAPKPQTKTPIKNGAVAPKVEAPATPRMNLDDILQRRRA